MFEAGIVDPTKVVALRPAERRQRGHPAHVHRLPRREPARGRRRPRRGRHGRGLLAAAAPSRPTPHPTQPIPTTDESRTDDDPAGEGDRTWPFAPSTTASWCSPSRPKRRLPAASCCPTPPRRSPSGARSSPSARVARPTRASACPCTVKKGDEVIYGKYAGTEVKSKGEEYKILRENEILALISVGLEPRAPPSRHDASRRQPIRARTSRQLTRRGAHPWPSNTSSTTTPVSASPSGVEQARRTPCTSPSARPAATSSARSPSAARWSPGTASPSPRRSSSRTPSRTWAPSW